MSTWFAVAFIGIVVMMTVAAAGGPWNGYVAAAITAGVTIYVFALVDDAMLRAKSERGRRRRR